MTKSQVIPMCLRKLEELRDILEGDDDDHDQVVDYEARTRDLELVEKMVEDKEMLNRVTKDILAVLSVKNGVSVPGRLKKTVNIFFTISQILCFRPTLIRVIPFSG